LTPEYNNKTEKKKILIATLLSFTVANMMINNIVAVLPEHIEHQQWTSLDGYTLNEDDTALIIGIFSIGELIFAPFNGPIKNALGSKNAILYGFTMIIITTIGLGVISNISDPH